MTPYGNVARCIAYRFVEFIRQSLYGVEFRCINV